MSGSILRLAPYEYAHITNENTNITELVVGPTTRTLASDERLSKSVTPFHVVPPGHYCVVENPHARTPEGTPLRDSHGQVCVRIGEREVRSAVPAFPLYPEELLHETTPMIVLARDEALLLRALRPFTAADGVSRPAGSRFLFDGPGAYCPRPEAEVLQRRRAVVVPPGHAIRLRAAEALVDATGKRRSVGEEYLYHGAGPYQCLVGEECTGRVVQEVLRPGRGVRVEVQQSFLDERDASAGTQRLAGSGYVVTRKDALVYHRHPCERVVRLVQQVHVSSGEYAIVVDEKTGTRRVVTNESFFLRVGESLEGGKVQPAYTLRHGEALLLHARTDFMDNEVDPPVLRKGGDKWLLHGPRKYIPHAAIEMRSDTPAVRGCMVLNEGEGIYVRNQATGAVRTVNGPAGYMLDADEELWEKKLSPDVERCLVESAAKEGNVKVAPRVPYRTVMYKVPNRCVTQVYNYRTLRTRTIFGPERVLLEPDEEFTVVALSGSPTDPDNPFDCLPKEESRIKALHLFLGPSNMMDVVRVETRDHAQLALQLCYAWRFDITHGDEVAAGKCFSVGDFVGDTCSLIAGRIRAAVAPLPFEQFHKNSAKLLRLAVCGADPSTGLPLEELRFEAYSFVVTSVDTQKMQILDSRTREGLQKSVKIAIEISTQAQESNAQQVALAREQEARGLLERQMTQDQVANEAHRKMLLEEEARSLATSTSGRLRSAADATARAAEVEQHAALEVAQMRAAREDLLSETNAELERRRREQQHRHEMALATAAQELEAELARVENDKFAAVMEAMGPDTVKEIAKAGPELQAKLLASLGLEGYLVMDGSTPVNLFRTAAGMTAQKAT